MAALCSSALQCRYPASRQLAEDRPERCVHQSAAGTLNRFMRRISALALLSHKSDVDWLSWFAFDLLLGALQEVPFTVQGMRKLDRSLNGTALGLRRRLAFRIDCHRARARRER